MKKIYEKVNKIIANDRIQAIFLVLEMLVFVVTFVTLTGGQGVDFDEALSWDVVVNNDFKGILAATAADVHPPLYYLIVKIFFLLFGASIKVMVCASIVPVILGMLMTSVFVTKRWGCGTALLFNLVYAFSPFMLHYALNLRMYSWMALFVLGVVLISYEISIEGKKWQFCALFFFSIASVYTQYFAVIPIVVCYIWLFIVFLQKKNWKGLAYFVFVGVLDVITYIPWLIYGMKNMGIAMGGAGGEYKFYYAPSVIFNTLFESNLENGDVMAGILFFLAVALFVLLRKRYISNEKSFIVMLFVNTIFSWYFSQWLGSLNGHFFHPRYVLFCLVFVWLLFSIVFARSGVPVYILFCLWSLEICLSSYLVERAYEYETTPLMPYTVAFIDANVPSDAVFVYDYHPDFYVIWEYYLPGHEIVYFDDLDLDDMRGQSFWVINISGAEFGWEEIEEYSLEIEHNPGMGFMGMERFDLWKVSVGE